MSAAAPRLRADLTIIEQVFRGEQSYVVKDPTTHAYYRFRPVEVRVMRLLDGLRSVGEIAETLVADGLRITAETVDGFARKLSKLGLLERSLLERSTQQLERLRSERRRQRSLFRGELFRLRFSFGDPDRLLTRTYPMIRWCFTPGFVALSIALFLTYLIIMVVEAPAFTRELATTFSFDALTPWSIMLFVGAFTLLTAIHELGHAYACKHFGGEVHEMGFMLLYFMPAFYANVNDAWGFPERRARLWVTAAGGWIELFVTSLLAIAWLVGQPGSVLSQLAIVAMLVGGVANLATNANPLLPLDGYFALIDWLEITNLRQRAKEYAGVWLRRYVMRQDVRVPELDERERRILLSYGVSATAYITGFLLLLASRLISNAYHTLGVLVAGLLVLLVLFLVRRGLSTLWGAVRSAVGTRLRSGWRALRTGGSNSRRRRIALAGAAMLLIATAAVPVGMTAHGAFTIQPVTSITITAPAGGVVSELFVREGDAVVAGAPVARLIDVDLSREALRRVREADSLQLGAQFAEARLRAGDSDVLAAQSTGASASAAEATTQLAALRLRARADGQVVTPRPERLIGRRVAFGDTLLQLADFTSLEAVIHMSGAGAVGVRPGDPVRLLSYRNTSMPLEGVVESVSPAADDNGRALEARVRVPADVALLAGATGEARVTWRRTTLLGAVVWRVRSWLRSDLLL